MPLSETYLLTWLFPLVYWDWVIYGCLGSSRTGVLMMFTDSLGVNSELANVMQFMMKMHTFTTFHARFVHVSHFPANFLPLKGNANQEDMDNELFCHLLVLQSQMSNSSNRLSLSYSSTLQGETPFLRLLTQK